MPELVLMRHAHSLSAREAGVQADSERPLSPRGEQEALAAIKHLSASGFAPALIVSSPYLRADRTAEIAAAVFPAARRETDRALSDGPAQAVLDLLLRLARTGGRALIVGHQPLMGSIAGYFLEQDGFDLSPAGFVRLNYSQRPGGSSLAEFYTPPPFEGLSR
jgi:phosphohistidine phosphatase